MSNNNNLFSEFPTFSKEEWLNKVLKDLKGRPFDDLKWHLNEKITIDPFYHPDDSIEGTIFNNKLVNNNEWNLGEDFKVENPDSTNKALISALENGINAPRLIFDNTPSSEDFEKLFQDVIPNYIQTHFKINAANPDFTALLENYYSYLQSRSIESKNLVGSIHLDGTKEEHVLKLSQKLFPSFKNIHLDFTDQAVNVAHVVDSLSEIIKRMDQTLQQIEASQVKDIELSLAIGTSYFVEIAKIRSIKILWANLLNAYGVEDRPLTIDAYIHPKAFGENKNTNMIRSMTIAMSAVIGGTNRLTILPSDQEGSSFSNRIARNVQHLLKMESYLDRVIDPAAGSFYIEKLTRLFSTQAWERFTLK